MTKTSSTSSGKQGNHCHQAAEVLTFNNNALRRERLFSGRTKKKSNEWCVLYHLDHFRPSTTK
ncbi:MAG: hypothetical protein P4L53_23395 [Candidatus Obscuribacterales bacterium]|nr:hypothetical protein [Candidatus Obscuribacterales bacterium]